MPSSSSTTTTKFIIEAPHLDQLRAAWAALQTVLAINCQPAKDDEDVRGLAAVIAFAETHPHPEDASAPFGDVFVAMADDTFLCEACATARAIDLGADETQTWEVGGGGWLAPVVCDDCALSIPVVIDGTEGAADE